MIIKMFSPTLTEQEILISRYHIACLLNIIDDIPEDDHGLKNYHCSRIIHRICRQEQRLIRQRGFSQCRTCGAVKPVKEIVKVKDKLTAVCKDCDKERAKKFRSENPDYYNAYINRSIR